jgi:putative oxidoreductase
MASFLESFRGEAYALFRIVTAFLLAAHGSQKLLAFPAAAPATLPDFVRYAAGPIELVGGLLIMIGLFTRYAAFIASGLMACAYWMVHGGHFLRGGWLKVFPIENGGELAALYCFAFLFIATQGAGIWSVDRAISGGSPSRADD